MKEFLPHPDPSPVQAAGLDRRQFLAAGASLIAAPMLLRRGSTPARAERFLPSAGAPTVTLNNGVEMPILGFGTYQLGGEDCERCVSEALEAGYRSFDTASAYRNEEAVGRALKASGLPRKELFVTSKLWVTDAGEQRTKAAFERSLELLGLESLDLYLIHQPYNDVYGAWRVMENLNREGRIQAIGVSNFHPDRVMDLILHHEIKPAVNQIETHPFYQRADSLAFLQAEGVQMEAWSPFAQGRSEFFQNEVLGAIGAKYGKTVAQVTLRWHVQRGVVVIPKSSRNEHILENLAVFDFELSPEDLAEIGQLETGRSVFFDHRDPQTVRMIAGRGRNR